MSTKTLEVKPKVPAREFNRTRQSPLGMMRELVGEIRRERRGDHIGHYVTTHVLNADQITENRQFATKLFVELGKIKPEAVDNETGLLISDRFHEAGAVQYASTHRGDTGELVAVGKLIWGEGIQMEELRTPFEDIQELNPEMYERLKSLPDGSVAELGSLAKGTGVSQVATLGTLREIYKIAEENGVEYIMAGLEPKAWPRYHALFGDGIELVSETPLQYPGIDGDQVGICMNVTQAYEMYRQTHVGSLGLWLQQALVRELFANKVPSFHSRFGDSGLRKLP